MKWLVRWLVVKITRDLVLFALGGYGFIQEVHASEPSEAIIIASVAMMGAPVALRLDEKKQDAASCPICGLRLDKKNPTCGDEKHQNAQDGVDGGG